MASFNINNFKRPQKRHPHPAPPKDLLNNSDKSKQLLEENKSTPPATGQKKSVTPRKSILDKDKEKRRESETGRNRGSDGKRRHSDGSKRGSGTHGGKMVNHKTLNRAHIDLLEELMRESTMDNASADCLDKTSKSCSEHGDRAARHSKHGRKSRKGRSFQNSVLKKDNWRDKIPFTVEQPARVAIRLEYLMGSKTAYLNDMGYIHRLHEAIVAEEERIAQQMTQFREEKEKARVRKLVLDGQMSPPAGMEELANHPIFKVNRLLQHMDKFDKHLADVRIPTDLKQRITPVEPFKNDSSGLFFKQLHEQSLHHDLINSPSLQDYLAAQGYRHRWGTTTEEIIAPPGSFAYSTKRKRSYSEFAVKFQKSGGGKTDSASNSTQTTPRDSVNQAPRRKSTKKSAPIVTREDDEEPEMKGSLDEQESVTWGEKKLQERLRQQKEQEKEDERKRQDMTSRHKLMLERKLTKLAGERSKGNFTEDEWKSIIHSTRLAGEEGEPGDAFDTFEFTQTNLFDHEGQDMTVEQLEDAFNHQPNVNLKTYEPFESSLIHKYIDEASDAKTMFRNAEDIRLAYERENLAADDFVKQMNKILSGVAPDNKT